MQLSENKEDFFAVSSSISSKLLHFSALRVLNVCLYLAHIFVGLKFLFIVGMCTLPKFKLISRNKTSAMWRWKYATFSMAEK